MRLLDRIFQRWRLSTVRPWVSPGARLLDVGCGEGALFLGLRARIREGVGIDPDLKAPVEGEFYRLLPGTFPRDLPDMAPFDVITMLAVLEHMPPPAQALAAERCAALLKPGGRLVLTVPSPAVDHILHVLKRLPWLYEGRSLEEHYGYQASLTPAVFHQLALVRAAKFQFGLNNLFVFRKRA